MQTLETFGVMQSYDGKYLEVKRAWANVPAVAFDQELVAAVAGKRIAVLSVFALCGATATRVTFGSKLAGQSAAAISPDIPNPATGGELMSHNKNAWMITNAGEALTVTTTGGSITALIVTYVEAV